MNNDDKNIKLYKEKMMLLFEQIIIYLLANLREKQQRDIMTNAMRNHSTIFAHFTNEADAKKSETSEISTTSTSDDDAKKAKQEAEEQEADAAVNDCQKTLDSAIQQRKHAYKNFIKCLDVVLKSITVVDIYIFMSTIRIHIKEQDCANDFKIDFINVIGCLLFTKEQRTFLKIY
jgi:hypothetical protein